MPGDGHTHADAYGNGPTSSHVCMRLPSPRALPRGTPPLNAVWNFLVRHRQHQPRHRAGHACLHLWLHVQLLGRLPQRHLLRVLLGLLHLWQAPRDARALGSGREQPAAELPEAAAAAAAASNGGLGAEERCELLVLVDSCVRGAGCRGSGAAHAAARGAANCSAALTAPSLLLQCAELLTHIDFADN